MPITTANNRGEILDHVVNRFSAVYVDSMAPLNYCGLSEIDLPDGYELQMNRSFGYESRKLHADMEAPMLLEVQTANAMRLVRKALKPEVVIKFDALRWDKAAKIAWQCVR
jgi:hypothetical protein